MEKQRFKLLKSDRVEPAPGTPSVADFAGATLVFGSWQVIASGSDLKEVPKWTRNVATRTSPRLTTTLLLVTKIGFQIAVATRNYFCWPTLVVKTSD